jgi:arginyl-tRNA synthetase
MILYGYKHFLDEAAFRQAPVAELGRLYQLVNQLVTYFATKPKVGELEETLQLRQATLAEAEQAGDGDKRAKKLVRQLRKTVKDLEDERDSARRRIEAVESSPQLAAWAAEHPDIGSQVLAETARLHDGDEENTRLWREFMPFCRDEMQKVYDRLHVTFDHELGESFYHDRLAGVVQRFVADGIARESDGAICVFLDGFDAPMIIQKQDGAFLYATTDLATIDYRLQEWQPDEILYVVDHRQEEHFAKLFAAARLTGREANYRHIKFGTVLGKDGRPFKTREGALGLEWLLDLAVGKAYEVVCANDDAKKPGPELSEEERRSIARAIGHAAVKYADLSQNRESDYEFNEERMVANEGNTATYMQYSYARIAAIFRKGDIDIESLRTSGAIALEHPEERSLALEVLRLQEAIEDSLSDYRPNLLAGYVYNLASKFSTFYDKHHVLNAEEPMRTSRLLLCDLVGRTIRQVLELMGIQVVERM